jgi:hypothetical protein
LNHDRELLSSESAGFRARDSLRVTSLEIAADHNILPLEIAADHNILSPPGPPAGGDSDAGGGIDRDTGAQAFSGFGLDSDNVCGFFDGLFKFRAPRRRLGGAVPSQVAVRS